MFWRLLNGLVLGLSLIFFSLALANAMPSFPLKSIVVSSGSMSPTIKTGDLVLVWRSSRYFPGEVILYRWRGKLILHRLVEIKEDGFITKGDANPLIDRRLVVPNTVLGKVVLTIPNLGKIAVLRSYHLLLPLLILLFGGSSLIYLLKKDAA